MRFPTLALALAFIAPAAGALGQQAVRSAGPHPERLEVPRVEVAPVLEARLPDRGGPKLPARELLRAQVPFQRVVARPDPAVARAGRLALIPHDNEVVGEPIPPPRDPELWPEDFDDRPAPARPEFRFAGENLDNWVFGNMATEALRREWLGSVLDERVAAAVSGNGLTRAQAEKLRLAGRGDIERFFARVGRERREFEQVRAEPARALPRLEGTGGLAKEFRRGPFGIGSLFEKTLARMTAGRRQLDGAVADSLDQPPPQRVP